MRLLFSIFNPHNIFYLWFNRPVSHTCIKYTFKYYLNILGLWLIFFLIALQTVVFGNATLTKVLSSYWLSVLMLLLFMQTLSMITIPLKLYRVYLTETSIIQTWWFIKIIEVKKNDIFAIDINRKGKKVSLHVFIADKLLGGIVMERIISDIDKGFYIEPTAEFVEAIKKNINSNLLTKDVINYPEVTETKDLRNDISKLSDITLKEKTTRMIYLSLMLLHPISVFLILEYFYRKFLLSLILSSLMMPILDYVRQKLSSRLTATIKKIPEIDKIYSNQPIEERMNTLNEYLNNMKSKTVLGMSKR